MKCCATSCGIAATLLAGMAYCTYMGNRSELVKNYMQSLTKEQQQTYAKIVEERRGIYLRGFGWGLLLSALLLGVHHQYATMSRAAMAGATEAEAAAAAGSAATKAAIQAAAVQQGADVGASTYERMYEERKKQGATDEQAAADVLNSARAAGVSGAIISLLMQRLPGA